MAISHAELDRLSERAREDLRDDLAAHGTSCAGLTAKQTQERVPGRRGLLLHAWLRRFGPVDPVRMSPRARRTRHALEDTPGSTHVVFGDCHAAPGQDLRRFEDMGRIVREVSQDTRGPVHVVQIGDWYSFDSLCTHESIRRRAEGRVAEEISAGELALELFHRTLGPTPDHVSLNLTLGNHDVRVDKLADEAPWFDGMYDVSAAHRARGWNVVPYRTPLRLDGVRYQHDLPSRGGGRAIGGVNAARTLLTRVHHRESIVVGHNHVLQHAIERPHLGRPVHAIVAGCWLDHLEEYAGEDNTSWWSGCVVLRGVVSGDPASVEFRRRS